MTQYMILIYESEAGYLASRAATGSPPPSIMCPV